MRGVDFRSALAAAPALRWLSVPAAVGFALVTLFVFGRLTAFALLAAGVAVGFALYALFGPGGAIPASAPPVDDPRLPGVLTLVFFAATAAGVLALSGAYYAKPPVYYVSVGIAAGAIAVRVFATDTHPTNVGLAFLYGLNTFFSNQLAFPAGLDGPDSGHHIGLARNVYLTGHVADGGVYNGFPGQHVFAATAAHLAGTPIELTYRTVGILGMTLGIPVTYLLARRLADRRTAVLAMVVYASMDYVVYRAGHPSKLAYALPLLLLVFTMALYLYGEVTPGRLVLFALFAVALVFTHHYTAVMGVIMLGALAAGQRLEPHLAPLVAGVDPVPRPGVIAGRLSGRGHVLVVLFLVAFLTEFLYFSGFFDQVVSIGERYVAVMETYTDTLFGGGSGSGDATKQTPRFNTIPVRTLLVNTVGSGLLAAFTVLGSLDRLDRGRPLTVVLLVWFATAATVMVFGVVSDVPFALPNRIYVMVEITGVGIVAAAGLVYLHRRLRSVGGTRTAIAVVVVLVACFALFSTASTIAGIETSPFNEEVGHGVWYEIEQESAARAFAADAGISEDRIRFAGTFPVSLNGTVDYSDPSGRTVVLLGTHRISTGVKGGQAGQGRIGSTVWIVPEHPRRGLENTSLIYDNGDTTLYVFDGRAVRSKAFQTDPPVNSTRSRRGEPV